MGLVSLLIIGHYKTIIINTPPHIIQMVDLVGQYRKNKTNIDNAISSVLESGKFIKGDAVTIFESKLSEYLNAKYVISCANGTDALLVALMSLELEPGDEVILPAFTYAATAEVVGLLKLKPVLVDVDSDSFNISVNQVKEVISAKTKVVIPVHLFGQCSNMEELVSLSKHHGFKIIEDNAQAIGCDYTFKDGTTKKAGTIGDIGTTSFFPTKNLGCYGDGGAIFTSNDELAEKLRMICNHGQKKKYHHTLIGLNSRLDTIQAAVLNEKLLLLDEEINKRRNVAHTYNNAFMNMDGIETPSNIGASTNVYHQYTLKVKNDKRDALKEHLKKNGIPSTIYYPLPLHQQEAYKKIIEMVVPLVNSESLCSQVLSLPIHSELESESQEYIIQMVSEFYNSN